MAAGSGGRAQLQNFLLVPHKRDRRATSDESPPKPPAALPAMTTVRLLVLAAAVAVLAAAAPAAAYEDECSQFPTCAQCLNVTSAGVLAGGAATHTSTHPKQGTRVECRGGLAGGAWEMRHTARRLPPPLPPPSPLPSSLCALRLAAAVTTAVDLCRCPCLLQPHPAPAPAPSLAGLERPNCGWCHVNIIYNVCCPARGSPGPARFLDSAPTTPSTFFSPTPCCRTAAWASNAPTSATAPGR